MHDLALAANVVRVLSAQIADRSWRWRSRWSRASSGACCCQLAERWGRVTPDGIRLDLRLTHQELANMVGRCASP